MTSRGRWGALLLALPFAVVALGTRGLVPAWGDRIARQVRDVAAMRVSTRHAPPPALSGAGALAGSIMADASDASADTSLRADRSGSRVATAPPRPLRISAAAVQRAIDDAGRSMHARTTLGPDGKPAGTRLTGVNRAGIGLRDGDVIIAVDGKPALDDDAATDAALSVVARGDSVLHATLTRDGQPFEVTLDLPLAPVDAGKIAR